jgi:multisubunit Na+/H+ antiporter MnhB subunit
MYEATSLLFLRTATVVLIVMDRRLPVEQKMRSKYGFDREWRIPVIAVGVGLAFSVLSFSSLQKALLEKFEVIALIFPSVLCPQGLENQVSSVRLLTEELKDVKEIQSD